MRIVVSIAGVSILTSMFVNFTYDFFDGANDLFGIYPRVPDREKLKKQLEQAAELKKFYVAPSQYEYKSM